MHIAISHDIAISYYLGCYSIVVHGIHFNSPVYGLWGVSRLL